MQALLSVVIPVYRIKENYLRNCLDCLLDQGREDFEIILVDDGSPDNCGAICDEYAANNEIVTVIHQENQGAAVARNSGINRVTTPWLSFVDGDDWVEKDYINTIYEYLTIEAFDADILMFNYIKEYASLQDEKALKVQTGLLSHEDMELCRKSVFFRYDDDNGFYSDMSVPLWAKVYRVSFLKENNVRFVPEARKGQDRLFNAEALTVVSKIFYIHKQLYHYRCTEGSRTNRYDPKVPELVTIELKGLQRLIEKYNIKDEVGDFFDCYVSTRLYSCMRLTYFHDSNPAHYKERLKGLKALVGSEPYRSALKNVDMHLLSLEEKVFVYCIKLKLYWACSLLVKAKSGITKKKLG